MLGQGDLDAYDDERAAEMQPQRDLFGFVIPKRFPTSKAKLLELFAGDQWMRAAEDWARGHNTTVEAWRALGRRFKLTGAGWFTIAWEEELERWEVTASPEKGGCS